MSDDFHKLNAHNDNNSDDHNKHFYNDNAERLARQYLSTSCANVHAAWLPHFEQMLAQDAALLKILDVGAGAGRDARYFAQQSHCVTSSVLDDKGQGAIMPQNVEVVAVEPAHLLAERGKQYTQGCNVTWIDDRLPDLHRLAIYQHSFNLILLSAVWMHIPADERITALQSLEHLLAPHGKLVISLRHGDCQDARVMHPVSVDGLEDLASKAHLTMIACTDRENDQLDRPQVFWQSVILQRSHDVSAKDNVE